MQKSLKKSITVVMVLLMTLTTVFSCNTDISAMDGSVEAVANSGYEFITDNATFSLFANKQSGQFYIQDKSTQTCWYSNPAVNETDSTSAVFKMEQSSLIIINSYDETADILSKSNSEAMSVRKNSTTFKTVDNGFEIVYDFSALDIQIPLRITLNEDGFNACVPVEEIKEESTLFGLSVLPYFGAGHPQDSGYILLPDGSGSLMYFNNERQSAADYRVPIYGRDALSSVVTEPQAVYEANMPIFGIKNSQGATFAIIEKGAAQAAVNAVPNNKTTPYAICYADFSLRGTDTVILGENTGSAQSYLMYQKDDISIEGIDIRYTLVADGNADYNTMAQIYREYLIKKHKLEYKDSTEPTVFLDFYGAVKKKKSVLGIPFTTTQSLSKLSEISEILDTLNKESVDGVQLLLQQWTKEQLAGKADGKLSLIGGIGSKKELKELMLKAQEQGGGCYPAIEFQQAAKSGKGYSVYRDTVRNVSNMPAGNYTFKRNTLVKDTGASKTYFLRVSAQSKLISRILTATERYGMENLFLGELKIYTDYGKKTVARSASMSALADLINKTGKQKSLMIENPPEYAFSAVKLAVNVPTSSNGYTATDKSVPFYQLVVSGLFSYCTKPINLAGDSKQLILKSLETGSALHYAFITEDNTIVDGTRLDWLYSADFNNWKESLIENYKITKQLFDVTGGSRLLYHTYISDGVTCTTYENGAKVYVNYTEADYLHNGSVIGAEGYLICEAEGSVNE